MGATDRLIIWRPFKLTFFELFQPKTGLVNLSVGAWPNSGSFSDKFFGVWKPEVNSTMFPVIPGTS